MVTVRRRPVGPRAPLPRPPRLRVRGFQHRPSVVQLLRALDRDRAVLEYQRAMSVRTR